MKIITGVFRASLRLSLALKGGLIRPSKRAHLPQTKVEKINLLLKRTTALWNKNLQILRTHALD